MVARAEQFLDYFYKTEQIHSTGCSHFRDISILLLSRHVSAVCLRLILNFISQNIYWIWSRFKFFKFSALYIIELGSSNAPLKLAVCLQTPSFYRTAELFLNEAKLNKDVTLSDSPYNKIAQVGVKIIERLADCFAKS